MKKNEKTEQRKREKRGKRHEKQIKEEKLRMNLITCTEKRNSEKKYQKTTNDYELE